MDLASLNIIFMGTPRFARDILAYLNRQQVPIDAVVTQPDRPAGRKKELVISPVKQCALQQGIEVLQFETIDSAAIAQIKQRKPHLILVAAYGLILPKPLLSIPPFGCINVHPSLLPRLRGPSPIQTALLRGASRTGSSLMLMNEKMDAGDILAQQAVPIDPDDTYLSLEHKLNQVSQEMLLPTLDAWINGRLQPRPQDHAKASFCQIITKADGRIIWTEDVTSIYRRFVAFSEWPKIYAYWPCRQGASPNPQPTIGNPSSSPACPIEDCDPLHTHRRITFHSIEISTEIQYKDKRLGEVFQLADGTVAIAANQGILIPKTLQIEGKSPLDIQAFLNGCPQLIGSILQ